MNRTAAFVATSSVKYPLDWMTEMIRTGAPLLYGSLSTTGTGVGWFRGAPTGLLPHQVLHHNPGAVKTLLGLNQVDLETRLCIEYVKSWQFKSLPDCTIQYGLKKTEERFGNLGNRAGLYSSMREGNGVVASATEEMLFFSLSFVNNANKHGV